MHKLLGTMIACLMLSSTAFAVDLEKLKATIAKKSSDLTITNLAETPVKGLYELTSGKNIYYIDESGTYLLAGHLYDLYTKTDLTEPRLDKLNRIDWSSLPLDQAIVSGDPKGKAVAVFTDPDCGYCKLLEKNIATAKGIQFYTFLFPLESIHPDAKRKSQVIWCSKDSHKTMIDVMLNGKEAKGKTDCETPIQANIELGMKLGIRGTPTLISPDGRKTGGALSLKALHEWLDQK
ncbi:MAG: DsbC family protein [Mariprofundaceae bacterium]|nr:DsbC family protein [Mariprofundaceae bacterium]